MNKNALFIALVKINLHGVVTFLSTMNTATVRHIGLYFLVGIYIYRVDSRGTKKNYFSIDFLLFFVVVDRMKKKKREKKIERE